MRTIITTVGTSLLTNAKRELKVDTPTDEQIANYLRAIGDEKASAETNSLSRILQEGDRIVFICSHTEDGKRCAELLRRHYANEGYQADRIEVPDLNYSDKRFQNRGLRSLVNILAQQIQEAHKRQHEVVINATGGFKAEIAYATLIGLLFRVPVCYIHEMFRDIIMLPATPIGWDFSLIANYEAFFEWIDEEPRPAEDVDERIRSFSEQDRAHITMLLEDDTFEGKPCKLLSPMGEAFYQTYREKIEFAPIWNVYLSDSALETYRKAEPSVREVFKRLLQQLANAELRRSQSEPKTNTDCLAYPQGHRDERVLYFEEGDKVYVCELARHSDETYERLLDRGVRKSDYPKDKFVPATEVIGTE